MIFLCFAHGDRAASNLGVSCSFFSESIAVWESFMELLGKCQFFDFACWRCNIKTKQILQQSQMCSMFWELAQSITERER